MAGRLRFRIRRTRPGAHSCSYEEGKFFYTPGLALLGLPATPGARCGGQTAVGIEWFGAARIGNLLPRVAGGSSRSGEERLAAYDRRPPRRGVSSRSDSGRQPYARAAGHVSTERNGGFAPRYCSATHIWASTTTTGTLLPNRVVGVNVNARWDTRPLGAPPLPWWRAERYLRVRQLQSKQMAVIMRLAALSFIALRRANE
jgi:hypothetical protein